MPEITPLGWFHTAMGVIAILSGGFTLVKHREIALQNRSGQIYIGTTLITAGTALAIFQHGGFGPAHGLAVMTLVALAIGALADSTDLLGRSSRYVRAFSYTATLLFHGIPAVTDALLRLPPGDPMLTSLEDPIMRMAHLALLVLFVIGVSLQLRWIARQSHEPAPA